MKLLKKNIVEETPELKIAKANTHVEKAYSAFDNMIEEANKAVQVRSEAMNELHADNEVMVAAIERNNKLIEKARAEIQADLAYISRLEELKGGC